MCVRRSIPMALWAVVVLFSAGCGSTSSIAESSDAVDAVLTRIVQPGAPGQASRVVQGGNVGMASEADVAGVLTAKAIAYTDADVNFMQGMIGHHAQALDMTALIADRTRRKDLLLLGQRVEISQNSEIEMMQKWLRDRGEDAPDATADHMMQGHMEAMPGMLTPEQMENLTSASGDTFYKLWLEYMIQHHQGAVTMVRQLLASEGAAQETNIFRFADAVQEDQTMEIQRMRGMLSSLR
ncbi:MAG: hypothetical protein ACI80V_001593 [Rhodothermales bacterium]|jgi:uncharacterized protein (DUF305 family)